MATIYLPTSLKGVCSMHDLHLYISVSVKRDIKQIKLNKMRTIKNLAIIGVIALLTSCATTIKFPVSNVVPGADITVTKNQDKNNNYVIVLTAKNLAEANRLNPPKNNYSVWIVTDDGTIKNIGQLDNRNAKKAVLKTVSPFDVREIFITAEDQGNLTYPTGIEISRTRFN